MRISDWSSDVCSSDLSLAAAESYGKPFDTLDVEQKAALTHRLKQEYRHNSLDPETGVVTVSDRRARAIALTAAHYDRLYGSDPTLREMRDNYALQEDRKSVVEGKRVAMRGNVGGVRKLKKKKQ